jgi:hypothetical protein
VAQLIDSSQDIGHYTALASKVDENQSPDNNNDDDLNATFAACRSIASTNNEVVTIDHIRLQLVVLVEQVFVGRAIRALDLPGAARISGSVGPRKQRIQ